MLFTKTKYKIAIYTDTLTEKDKMELNDNTNEDQNTEIDKENKF